MNFRIPQVTFHKALLISTLYISQSVPVSFIKTGFQTYLKNQDIPYDNISKLLGLLLLPWALKFLWAPLIDRYGSSRIGHRKSWLIPLQIGGALVLGMIAFMDIESQLNQIVLLFFFYSFLCATQDIAVDGLAVLSLSKKEHGVGNSMQMGGYYMGELLGGAVILIVLDQYGWMSSILTLAAFYLIPLFVLLPYKETPRVVQEDQRTLRRHAIRSYFKGEQGVWLLLLILYMGNQVLARTLLPSLLKERSFTDTEVGFTIGVFGNSASIIGAIAGGLLMEYLGRKRSLMAYGIIKIPVFFLLLFVPMVQVSDVLVIGGIMLNDFTAGCAAAALFTVMMDKSRLSSPGTDFTIQQSINAIGVLIFVILSGIIQKRFGYTSVVITASVIGLLSLFLVSKLRMEETSET